MKVKDRLEQLKNDKYIVKHQLGTYELLENDWIRIYKSSHRGCIDELIIGIDCKDINTLSEDILNLEYDEDAVWFIGEDLSLDLVIKIN